MKLACILLVAALATGCISYHRAQCETCEADAKVRAEQEQRIADLEQNWISLRNAIQVLESALNQSPLNDRSSIGDQGGIVENFPYSSKVSAVDSVRNVVVLSVGKDDGVKPGFIFTVYRDDRYVGKVVVDDVDVDHCTGFSASEFEAKPIQVGDDARVVWEISERAVNGGEK